MTMKDMPAGSTAAVTELHAGERLNNRLLDLGLIKGTSVSCVMSSSGNDMIAYRIRGVLIALRSEDADNIFVIT